MRPFVRNFWAAESVGTAEACRRQRIVPDGCIDVILVRHSPTDAYRGSVVGTMTRPVFVEIPARAQYLGIRFAPGGFTQLFSRPAHEFTDRSVPLDGVSLSLAPAERMAESPGVEASFRVLQDCLMRRLAQARPNAAFGEVLEAISALPSELRVVDLARRAGCSPRQLLRIFRESVGVGPKTYCRIIRFKAALRALCRRPQPDLLHVALDAGYYDQAHFIHEFNAFYGSCPSVAMSVPYNTRG
ncbi:MAG: AraC family transcriptional regulator [Sedimentisphaerales bacterium]|nr:AraC family transcriptional regulator [Sedimentisphaerales bacterium]